MSGCQLFGFFWMNCSFDFFGLCACPNLFLFTGTDVTLEGSKILGQATILHAGISSFMNPFCVFLVLVLVLGFTHHFKPYLILRLFPPTFRPNVCNFFFLMKYLILKKCSQINNSTSVCQCITVGKHIFLFCQFLSIFFSFFLSV